MIIFLLFYSYLYLTQYSINIISGYKRLKPYQTKKSIKVEKSNFYLEFSEEFSDPYLDN